MMSNSQLRSNKKQKKYQKNCQNNKKRVEKAIMLNLYGEKDMNIYMFNRIGILLIGVFSCTLLIYFIIQIDKMRKSYYDSFYSVLSNYDHGLNESNNLHKDSNFMMFFQLKFESSEVANEFKITQNKIDNEGYGFDKHHQLDLERLGKFITFDMKFRKRGANGQTYFIRTRHRHCQKEDFVKKGYEIKLPSDYKNFVCLQTEKVEEYFSIKGSYLSDNNFLENIFLEVNRCYENCESEQNIQKFLKNTWINVYTLNEQVSFKTKHNLQSNDERLTIITPQLVNQIKPDVKSYSCYNMKLRKNIIQIPKGRFNLLIDQLMREEKYIFYNFHPQLSMLYSEKYTESQLVSDDGKQFYRLNGLQVLFGMYIYQSDDIFTHEINQYTFLDALSSIGGLLSISLSALFTIIRYLNYNSILEQLHEYYVYQKKYIRLQSQNKFEYLCDSEYSNQQVEVDQASHKQTNFAKYQNTDRQPKQSNSHGDTKQQDEFVDGDCDLQVQTKRQNSDDHRFNNSDDLGRVVQNDQLKLDKKRKSYHDKKKLIHSNDIENNNMKFRRSNTIKEQSIFKKWKVLDFPKTGDTIEQNNQEKKMKFGLFDKYFPIELYRIFRKPIDKLNLGQGIENYNRIIEKTNNKLCISRIIGKLYKIKYIEKDIENIRYDLLEFKDIKKAINKINLDLKEVKEQLRSNQKESIQPNVWLNVNNNHNSESKSSENQSQNVQIQQSNNSGIHYDEEQQKFDDCNLKIKKYNFQANQSIIKLKL